jgi:hypothetical protein
VFVDKILKGTKQLIFRGQPTKFEFVESKTAKQIGLTIPPNVRRGQKLLGKMPNNARRR